MKIGKKVRNKEKSSIALEEMRLSVPEQNVYKAGIFYFLLLMLGLMSSYGCFYSSFPIPVTTPVLIFFTILFCAVFTLLFFMKRKNTWFIVGAMSIITVIILFFRKTFYHGMLVTVKYILEEFRSHGSGIAFPNSLKEQLKGVDEKVESTFFTVCLFYILALLISWLLIKRRNFFLAGFITLPFVFAPLFVPIAPAFVSIVFLLFYYFTLIFLSPSLSGSKMFRKGLRGYHISSNSSANPITFLILLLFLVCIVIVSIIFPQSSFKRSPFLEAIRTTIINGFDSSDFSRYMNAAFGGDLSDVDLRSVGNISFNNLPAIGLTMNGDYYYNNSIHKVGENHTEYLKGYVGSVYSDEGWKDLSEDQSREVYNIFGSMDHSQNIYANIKSDFRYYAESRDYFNMSVKYIRGDPRRVYIPYGLSDTDNNGELRYIDDGYMVASNSDMGIDKYGYTAFSVFDDNENISLFERLKKLDSYYESYDNSKEYTYKSYTAENGEVYSGYGYFGVDDNGYIFFFSTQGYFEGIERYDPTKDYGDLFEQYTDTDDDSVSYNEIYNRLSKYLTTNQLDYIDALKKYDDFTSKTYTQVPDNISSKLKDFIKDNNIRTDNTNNTIADVVKVLKDSGSYKYTLSPGRVPDGTDFVEYFLFENKKGYCRHFATAATLLLREAGIPARYAEGYKFESTQFANTNYIELLDSNAHAWVEVYYSGTGWMPIEVTPGAGQSGSLGGVAESSLESSRESSSESSKSNVESSADIDPESSMESSEQHTDDTSKDISDIPETDNDSNIAPIVYIMLVPICCAVIYIILVLNRFIRVRKRRRSFNDRNINRAALALYGYIARLVLYRTDPKGGDTDYGRIEKLIANENTSAERREWCVYFRNEIYPIAEKARFSGKIISEDELNTLKRSAESIRSNIMSELNILQKFAAVYFDII